MSIWKWIFSLEDDGMDKHVKEQNEKVNDLLDPLYKVEQMIELNKSEYILGKISKEQYKAMKVSIGELIDKLEAQEVDCGEG